MPDASDVSFDRTVSKLLVHKWSLDQVFLTGFAPGGQGSMRLAAELPRSHGFYCEFPLRAGPPDLAAVVEACRQACFVVAHEQYDVPVSGFQFMFQELDARFTGPFPAAGDRPVDLVLDCTVQQRYRRGLVWSFAVTAGGAPVAEVRIRMIWIERPRWRQMRASMREGRELPPELVAPPRPATQVPAERVDRLNPANVVLATAARLPDGCWAATALVDQRHPVLFDHPIDHVYAMVQIEACRQLGLLAVAADTRRPVSELRLRSVAAGYTSVAEFDLPTELVAALEPAGDGTRVTVVVAQGEREASRLTLEIGPAPEAAAQSA